MKQEDFEKIVKDSSGYRKMIETFASMNLSKYNEGYKYWNEGKFKFEVVRYLNDTFSSDEIYQEEELFKMKLSDNVELVMTINELENELSLCCNNFYEVMHGITFINSLRMSGRKEEELDKINNKLHDLKVEFVLSAEALFEKFVIGAKEVRNGWV